MYQLPIRVYIEDTDAGGIVYHSCYLNYMERARSEWMRSRGYEHRQAVSEDFLLVVASVKIDYLRPALMDDLLCVGVEPLRLGKASVLLRQQVWREAQLLASAEVRLACVTASTKRLRSLPESVLQELNSSLTPG